MNTVIFENAVMSQIGDLVVCRLQMMWMVISLKNDTRNVWNFPEFGNGNVQYNTHEETDLLNEEMKWSNIHIY